MYNIQNVQIKNIILLNDEYVQLICTNYYK